MFSQNVVMAQPRSPAGEERIGDEYYIRHSYYYSNMRVMEAKMNSVSLLALGVLPEKQEWYVKGDFKEVNDKKDGFNNCVDQCSPRELGLDEKTVRDILWDNRSAITVNKETLTVSISLDDLAKALCAQADKIIVRKA